MVNYDIEKIEKAAKVLAGVCVSLLAGGMAFIVKPSGEDEQKEINNKAEQPKSKNRGRLHNG